MGTDPARTALPLAAGTWLLDAGRSGVRPWTARPLDAGASGAK